MKTSHDTQPAGWHLQGGTDLAGRPLDVHVAAGQLRALGTVLPTPPGFVVLPLRGGLILPGLADHHLHLAAMAAARDSVDCAPVPADSLEDLRERLCAKAAASVPGQWLRGIGLQPELLARLDADILERWLPEHPVRLAHRGGRLWLFNRRGLRQLQASAPRFEARAGRLTGRLLDQDSWLRQKLGTQFPDLSAVSATLAAHGITRLTDTGPANTPEILQHLQAQQAAGRLRQSVRMMGDHSLNGVSAPSLDCHPGERKFHLLESRLPPLDELVAHVNQAHEAGRGVAFHCVTRTELFFALAALEIAGNRPGDRIEHANVCPPDALDQMWDLGLTVVVQPGLIQQRGDRYLAEVDVDDRGALIPLRRMDAAGIPLAGSSDAPYTDGNPWVAMQAAVDRTTAGGQRLNGDQALTPERALQLYLGPLHRPAAVTDRCQTGAPAELCILDRPWRAVRENLAAVAPHLTWARGQLVHRGPAFTQVDESAQG